MKEMLSITELPNEKTTGIDISTALEIFKLFEAADEEIFSGYKEFSGFQSEYFTNQWNRAYQYIWEKIRHLGENPERNLKIILSGAGTSGRIAMLVSRMFQPFFQELFPGISIDYLIAGGDLALIKAQEIAEDDPVQGIHDLKEILAGSEEFIYIGITCGFSANYVGGQLHYTAVEKKQPAFLIGFNPLERRDK